MGEIIARFEKRGFKLVAMKLYYPTKKEAENHYADLSKKYVPRSLIPYPEHSFSRAHAHRHAHPLSLPFCPSCLESPSGVLATPLHGLSHTSRSQYSGH